MSKRPTLSEAALSMGITVDRVKSGEAYARNGNAHNPTPRYRWEVRHAGRLVGTQYKAGSAIELANDYAVDPR